MKVIKLALADDHVLFREGLKSIFGRLDDMEVVLETSNGKELLDRVTEHQPDVVLLDLEMPEMDGVECCKELKRRFPGIKILVLTMHEEERMTAYLMEIGANGYLLKNSPKDELCEAIRMVDRQGIYSSKLITNALLHRLQSKSNQPPSLNGPALTRREREVLELIAAEHTNNEIAEKLFISEKTVDGHRNNLLGKLGVRNTAGLIMKAIKLGLLPKD